MAQDKKRSWSLLGRLRTAVKKVTFLMNFNINQWWIATSMIGGGGASFSSRRLSFGDHQGLTAIADEDHSTWASPDSIASLSNQSDLQKTESLPLQRTISFPEEDDVDKRAEMFIANFYRQLKMERQVSLQLRYRRDTSFGSPNSFSP